MSQLKPRIKHIPLDFLGPEWEEAYIDFRAIKWNDAKALKQRSEEVGSEQTMEILIEFLQEKFLSGKGINDAGQTFDLSKDDLGEFDMETLNTLGERLAGAPDPNA